MYSTAEHVEGLLVLERTILIVSLKVCQFSCLFYVLILPTESLKQLSPFSLLEYFIHKQDKSSDVE